MFLSCIYACAHRESGPALSTSSASIFFPNVKKKLLFSKKKTLYLRPQRVRPGIVKQLSLYLLPKCEKKIQNTISKKIIPAPTASQAQYCQTAQPLTAGSQLAVVPSTPLEPVGVETNDDNV